MNPWNKRFRAKRVHRIEITRIQLLGITAFALSGGILAWFLVFLRNIFPHWVSPPPFLWLPAAAFMLGFYVGFFLTRLVGMGPRKVQTSRVLASGLILFGAYTLGLLSSLTFLLLFWNSEPTLASWLWRYSGPAVGGAVAAPVGAFGIRVLLGRKSDNLISTIILASCATGGWVAAFDLILFWRGVNSMEDVAYFYGVFVLGHSMLTGVLGWHIIRFEGSGTSATKSAV